jgi:lipoyl(octanoyl) transferase
VRALEAAMIATCAASGVDAGRRDGHPGCWVDVEGPLPRKIGALGIRVERGVAYHGIALNVDVAITDFELIDPCGMPGLVSTSIAVELGREDEAPSTAAVASVAEPFAAALAIALGEAPLHGVLPTHADPAAARAALERLLPAQAA